MIYNILALGQKCFALDVNKLDIVSVSPCLSKVMVVVKYLFQFGFFPWNSEYELKLNENKPYFLPRILGLDKTDNYIRYDLLQLLALFFHRSLLQVTQAVPTLQQGMCSSHLRNCSVFYLGDRFSSEFLGLSFSALRAVGPGGASGGEEYRGEEEEEES